MRWSKVSSYCIRAGEYQIARYTVLGVDQFHVRHQGELIATKHTGPKAKQAATEHARRAR